MSIAEWTICRSVRTCTDALLKILQLCHTKIHYCLKKIMLRYCLCCYDFYTRNFFHVFTEQKMCEYASLRQLSQNSTRKVVNIYIILRSKVVHKFFKCFIIYIWQYVWAERSTCTVMHMYIGCAWDSEGGAGSCTQPISTEHTPQLHALLHSCTTP